MYVVILAGGGGTRLRPLSRDDRPKPFLPLVDGRTLIQHTVDRLPSSVSGVWVVADGRYRALIHAQVPGATILEEPQGRNTAAAIALATLAIDRPGDEVMVVLPADHAIADEEGFRRVVAAAAGSLATGAFGVGDPLVTLGIQVDRPATEYGYLQPVLHRGANLDGLQAYPLLAFEEKPTPERAVALWAESGVAWNAGMFLWRRRAIRQVLNRYTNLIGALGPAVESGDAQELALAYATLRTRSIDYEVMEPAAADGCVLMAAMDVGWSDIGGWTALLGAIGARGTGRVVMPDDHAVIGAQDLAIVPLAGGLAIASGPSTIHADSPAALLVGAAPDRDKVEQLLARVAALEAHES